MLMPMLTVMLMWSDEGLVMMVMMVMVADVVVFADKQIHIGGSERLHRLHESGELQAFIDIVRHNEAPPTAPEEPEGVEEGEAMEDVLNVNVYCEPDEFSELIELMRRPVSEGGLSIKDRFHAFHPSSGCFRIVAHRAHLRVPGGIVCARIVRALSGGRPSPG